MFKSTTLVVQHYIEVMISNSISLIATQFIEHAVLACLNIFESSYRTSALSSTSYSYFWCCSCISFMFVGILIRMTLQTLLIVIARFRYTNDPNINFQIFWKTMRDQYVYINRCKT